MVVWNPPWIKSSVVQPQPPVQPVQPIAPAQTDILTKWQNNELPPSLLQAAQVPSYDDWKFQTYTPEPGWGVKAQGYVPRQTAQPQLTSSLPTELLSKFQRPWEHPAEAITGGLEAYQKGVVKPIAAYGTLPPAEYGKLPEPSEVVKSYEERKMPWGTKGVAELLLDPLMWVGGGGAKGEKLIQQATKFAEGQLAKKGVGAIEDIIKGISKSMSELQARKIVEEAAEKAGLLRWIPGKKVAEKIPEVAPKVGEIVPPKTGMPTEVQNAVIKLRGALDEAQKLIKETKGLASEELAKRISKAEAMATKIENPIERAKVFWSQMKGAYPTAEGAITPVREAMSGEELRGMFQYIEDSGFQVLTTRRAEKALGKVLEGERLQQNEVTLLEKIFGEGTFKEFSSSTWSKVSAYISDIINLPKAVEAAADISGWGRQGLGLVMAYPKRGIPLGWNMLKYFFSEKASKLANEAIWNTIKSCKWSDMVVDAYTRGKFYIAPWGEEVVKGVSKRITNREETFFSRFASWIPFVKMSERSFVVGLNKIRSDVLIKDILPRWEKCGMNITQQVVDDVAEMITRSSGRGDIGPLNKYANWVGGLFFSARFQFSRVQTPAHWARTIGTALQTKTPEAIAVAKENTRIMVSWVAANLTLLSVAYYGLKAAGQKVSIEKDPRSSDFGQLKVGNTRIDPWAGDRPYLVLLSRIISGATKQTTTGEIVQRRDASNYYNLAGTFIRGRLAPIPGAVIDITTGETIVGDDVKRNWKDIGKFLGTKFIPLGVGDIIDAIKSEGLIMGAGLGVQSLLGAGVTTYEPEPPKQPKQQTIIPFKAPVRRK